MSTVEVSAHYEGTYRPDKHARPKQHNTREQYRTDLRILNEAFRFRLCEQGERLRNVTLGDLSDELLKYAMSWQLSRGRTEGTANRLYRTIKAVWRDAFDRGLVAALPRTKKFEEPTREPRAWTLAEYGQIIGAAEQEPGWVGAALARDFFPAYGWFIYATGARQGVTLAVPAECFDETRGEVTLPAELQKDDAEQIFSLLPQAVAAIAKLRSRQRNLERLFGDYRGSVTAFNRRWRKIIVRAGLREKPEDVTRRELSHMIRRTFATQVVINSDEETARQLLGHSHISVTRKYIDKRQVGGPSARDLVPPLRPTPEPTDPPPTPPASGPLRIFSPDDEAA